LAALAGTEAVAAASDVVVEGVVAAPVEEPLAVDEPLAVEPLVVDAMGCDAVALWVAAR
jgi:hypothetical protein